MARRKLKLEDKSKPGLNFILLVPTRFSTSAPTSLQTKFDEVCKKKKINKSNVLRSFIFEFLEVKNENEMLDKYPTIRKAYRNGYEAILDELGLTKSDFSDWQKLKIEDWIKNNEKE